MSIMHEVVYSARDTKNAEPKFSRMSGGGSISETSIFSIDFDRLSTENDMLQAQQQNISDYLYHQYPFFPQVQSFFFFFLMVKSPLI